MTTQPAQQTRPLERELLDIITTAINHAPRTLQTRVGPSELGIPCARRLGYKMLGTPERTRPAAWLPAIGTAVHAWLETVIDTDNLEHAADRGFQERWLVETRVNVGQVGGIDITGSADLFDQHTGTVIDWKIVGDTQLKKYKAKGPGDQYRRQAHLYGRGFERAGHTVNHVMIAFLPRNSPDLGAGAYFWTEPYNPELAAQTLQRADGIAQAVNLLGPTALDHLEAVESYCNFCPYLQRGSTDLAAGCPGVDRPAGGSPQHQLTGLI